MRTVNLTIQNVIDIFNAGRRRGEAESTAAEWGFCATGRAKDDLIDALVDALNGQGDIVDYTYSQVDEWLKDKI